MHIVLLSKQQMVDEHSVVEFLVSLHIYDMIHTWNVVHLNDYGHRFWFCVGNVFFCNKKQDIRKDIRGIRRAYNVQLWCIQREPVTFRIEFY